MRQGTVVALFIGLALPIHFVCCVIWILRLFHKAPISLLTSALFWVTIFLHVLYASPTPTCCRFPGSAQSLPPAVVAAASVWNTPLWHSRSFVIANIPSSSKTTAFKQAFTSLLQVPHIRPLVDTAHYKIFFTYLLTYLCHYVTTMKIKTYKNGDFIRDSNDYSKTFDAMNDDCSSAVTRTTKKVEETR